MNGAESLLRTLVNGGVDVCFMNPGTSEMQFVAAIDRVEGMRSILGLFEGVVSGAADGYARMANKPAATLLHLGPGLANALSNFHNARRARIPIINIIGEHATYHRQCDPPLYSDIVTLAKSVSGWIETVEDPLRVPELTHAAINASLLPPGQIATLILPADCTWEESAEPYEQPIETHASVEIDEQDLNHAVKILKSGEPTALIVQGKALMAEGLSLANQIKTKTNARILCDTFNPRMQRGTGRAAIETIPYLAELAIRMLADFKHVILIGAKAPVGFFAYPGVPNRLLPQACEVHRLSRPEDDAITVLKQLVEAIGGNNIDPVLQDLQQPVLPTGELTPQSIGQTITATLPDNSIIVDESITSGLGLLAITANAAPHDWLFNTGGSLGQGMPVATGAAIACPDRKILSLEADGSGMYTLQALWTQARESLDVTTVIYVNREYRILNMEFERVGANIPALGTKAHDMMSLDRPDMDWVKMSEGLGVPAKRVTTAEAFNQTLKDFLSEAGPNLIEAII